MSVMLDYRKHVESDNVVPDIKWSQNDFTKIKIETLQWCNKYDEHDLARLIVAKANGCETLRVDTFIILFLILWTFHLVLRKSNSMCNSYLYTKMMMIMMMKLCFFSKWCIICLTIFCRVPILPVIPWIGRYKTKVTGQVSVQVTIPQ